MEKISQEQPTDLNFKCCFFGAIRGKRKNGELIGLISHAYTHRNDFSHKDFECSFYGSMPYNIDQPRDVDFDDPEVWKLSTPNDIFGRREDIIDQYKKENRVIEFVDIEVNAPC